jgi:hypothetical protein
VVANDGLGRMQKKVAMAYFILLYCIYFGATQKHYKTLRTSGYYELKFEFFLLDLRLHGISLL